jgi:hypothetical protein
VKLLMILVDEERREEIEVVLQRAGVAGYSEIPHVLGSGTTGPRLGSGPFPKTSALIFSIVADDAVAPLAASLRARCHDCGERFKLVTWGVEEVA